jgi:RNA 2',3'-cyclic 3'-phosphodiesterase
MTEEIERLFIAIPLPDAVRAQLAGLAEPMRGVSWTRNAQLHVTMRFLGDVPADLIGRIEERLRSVTVDSFILPVQGVGAFPPKNPPRVLWVGCGAGHPHLFQLRQRLDDALLATGLDFELRSFVPHITVARCTELAAPSAFQWLRRHREYTAAPFRAGSFDLYSSRLAPAGVTHILRRRFDLGGGTDLAGPP